MFRKRLKNPVFLFYLLVGYVVAQFSWWIYLIFNLYKDIYGDPEVLRHKIWMLVGEGTVFLIILLGGVYLINRALKRERDINELQENFLQSVSHELKTPIASVGLFIETLKKRKLSEDKRQDIYDRSLTEIKRLNNLINDILTARNIESQNYYINKEAIKLDDYLNEKIDSLRLTIASNYHIDLETEQITANLDKEALDSIIYNLTENACKYAPVGSTINIKAYRKGEKIILEVADQGIGLESEAKERVFDKFYRVENESTRKSKGTGLGLYITKFLVEKQDGKIVLKDNQPQGLVVEIEF